MTIKDIVKTIEQISLSHIFVKMFNEGDVYEFMNNGEKEYGIVNLNIDQIERETDSILKLYCSLIYIDRLTEDNDNKLDIWSIGTNVLQQIILKLEEKGLIVNGDYIFNNYTEDEFQDLCAGVYTNIDIQFKNSVNACGEGSFEPITPEDVKLQSKDASAWLNEDRVVKPDEGYDGLSQVNIKGIKSYPRDITITTNGQHEVLPPDGYEYMPWANVYVDVPNVEAVEITQAQYDALSEYDPNKIYLIID